MSTAVQFFFSTSLVYLGVDVLAVWGLNLQYGVTGILNFSFIIFQAFGAYFAGVLMLGPDTANGGYQKYILGLHLPFALVLLLAALAGAVLSLPIGWVALRRLRADYQAIALLVVSIIATIVVENDVSLFNGSAGLSAVPHPYQEELGLSLLGWQWFYVALVGALCLLVYFGFIRRITRSPLGRSLRVVRDNEQAASALGKPVLRLRIFALAAGCGVASLSGALLGPFIGSWAPSAWLYPETFVLIGAILIGGRANDLGVAVGALIFPVLIFEGSTFLPQFGRVGLVDALEWVLTGLLILLFLYFRPRGIFPERVRIFPSNDRLPTPRLTRRGRLTATVVNQRDPTRAPDTVGHHIPEEP